MIKLFILISFTFLILTACGESGSNKSSRSAPDGVDQSRYNGLSKDGKDYVDKQMDAYDKATKK